MIIEARNTTHELKVWKEYYPDVESGKKPFEVRKNDRNYKVGDELYLREFDQINQTYTGNGVYKTVTYVLHGGMFGLDPDYCVMGLKPIEYMRF